jgi:hypothetical protein
MGYHLKICTISYDDILNCIQFTKFDIAYNLIPHSIWFNNGGLFCNKMAMILPPPPQGLLIQGFQYFFSFLTILHTGFLYAVCMYAMYILTHVCLMHVHCTYVHHTYVRNAFLYQRHQYVVSSSYACTPYAHTP